MEAETLKWIMETNKRIEDNTKEINELKEKFTVIETKISNIESTLQQLINFLGINGNKPVHVLTSIWMGAVIALVGVYTLIAKFSSVIKAVVKMIKVSINF